VCCGRSERKIIQRSDNVIVIYHSSSALHGDFMMDLFYAKKLQTTMLSLEAMKQYVNEPMRIMKDSQTIIDLIFANNNKTVQVIHELKITDHA